MGSQSWKRHQPKMKIFALFSLCIFSAVQAQFFGVETGYNNTCLWEKEGLNREGPREFDCPRFVIESTDQIWNMYRDPELIKFYLRKYMVDDWESISPMGEYLRGYEKLEPLVLDTMIAFPDIKLHIVDTFCEGNDIDGYKTTMPVSTQPPILVGTQCSGNRPTRRSRGTGFLTASSRTSTDNGSTPQRSTCPTRWPSTASWGSRPPRRSGRCPPMTATSCSTGTPAISTPSWSRLRLAMMLELLINRLRLGHRLHQPQARPNSDRR